jgi:hypothetical protein
MGVVGATLNWEGCAGRMSTPALEVDAGTGGELWLIGFSPDDYARVNNQVHGVTRRSAGICSNCGLLLDLGHN